MTFNSPSFLFIFLPALITLYFILGNRLRNWLLLLFSLVFYIWGERAFVVVLICYVIINYLLGVWINKYSDNTNSARKYILGFAIVLNISTLIVFNYANFFIVNANILFNTLGIQSLAPINIHKPLGISFITFTAISYIVDIYRKVSSPEKNPFNVAFYFSFFPKVVSGPLEQYGNIAKQVASRTVNLALFTSGVRRFIIGLAKKMLIANTLGSSVDQIFSIPTEQLSVGTAWLGIVCFTIQLYFDFSGYTDMAIGLARMFGFRLMENFNYPYISSSIREFWRRWHISMSQWFRDYLYIPLGGNKHGSLRTYMNLLLVFLICGFWHGANWTFIIWGLWHGIFLILERVRLLRLSNPLWRPFKHLYALLVIVIGWVFFRSASLPDAVTYIGVMFSLSTNPNPTYDLARYFNPALIIALIAGVIGTMPILPAINNGIHNIERRLTRSASNNIVDSLFKSIAIFLLCLIFIISLIFVISESNRPFIYSQF